MKRFAMILAMVGVLRAEVAVPEGTPIRVRLDNRLSSATAGVNELIEFVVVEEVRVGDTIVVESGARATGTVIVSEAKKRMGRGGKLDFTVDKVRATDGRYINVRPTAQGSRGSNSSVRTGLIAAGVAFVFWPAAPLVLLHKGKEAEMPRGSVYTVYTDVLHTVNVAGAKSPIKTAAEVQAPAPETAVAPHATVQVDADSPAAEVELDGKFVGNTPTTLSVLSGLHVLTVRKGGATWQREIELKVGTTASIQAQLAVPSDPNEIAAMKLK